MNKDRPSDSKVRNPVLGQGSEGSDGSDKTPDKKVDESSHLQGLGTVFSKQPGVKHVRDDTPVQGEQHAPGDGPTLADGFKIKPAGFRAFADMIIHKPLKLIHYDPVNRHIRCSLPGCGVMLARNGHVPVQELMWKIVHFTSYASLYPTAPGGEYWITNMRELIDQGYGIIGMRCLIKIYPSALIPAANNVELDTDLKVFKGGPKSWIAKTQAWTSDRTQMCFDFTVTVGVINMTTRKLWSLPENIGNSLPELDPREVSNSSSLDDIAPPQTAFCDSTKVSYSCLDMNGHLNFAWYVNYAMDATALALVTGYTDPSWTVTEQHLNAGLAQCEIIYCKECFINDHLNVYVWQENGESEVYRNGVGGESSSHEAESCASGTGSSSSRRDAQGERTDTDANTILCVIYDKQETVISKISLKFNTARPVHKI